MGHSDLSQPSSNYSDQEIMRMDPDQAIETIMALYGDEIKRLIFTYMKNSADTDDVSQDVFVTVYQKLHTFKGKSALKSWLYSIAINKCKDYLRSWHVRSQNLKEKINQSPQIETENRETPEDYLIQQAEQSELLKQVLDLPMTYREVVILYYLNELSIKETSHALHIRETTVRTRLFRARKLLKQRFTVKRGGDLG